LRVTCHCSSQSLGLDLWGQSCRFQGRKIWPRGQGLASWGLAQGHWKLYLQWPTNWKSYMIYQTTPFWMTLSDLAKYSMTPGIARSFCNSWASCQLNNISYVDKCKQELSYCKQLRTQYVEGICNNCVTLKSRLRPFKLIETGAIPKLGCGFLFSFYSNCGCICSRLWDIQRQRIVYLQNSVRFVQGHWKWHYLIDRIWVPISV